MPITRPAFVSRHKKPPQEATHQQVYSADYSTIYEIPLADVHHIPPRATRLVLCSTYDAAHPSSCAAGSRCKAVHGDLARALRGSIHVNYAYRAAEAVKYDRFPAGETLYIAAPNDTDTMDVIASELVLRSRALESSRRPLSHCAHYYFNRTCNLGSECQFIHAVYIDPNAREGQRAPLPSQMGRSYRPEDRPKARAAPRSPVRSETRTPSPPLCEASVNSHPATEGADLSSAASLSGSDVTPVKPLRRPVQAYRFNPYSQHSAYLVLSEE